MKKMCAFRELCEDSSTFQFSNVKKYEVAVMEPGCLCGIPNEQGFPNITENGFFLKY